MNDEMNNQPREAIDTPPPRKKKPVSAKPKLKQVQKKKRKNNSGRASAVVAYLIVFLVFYLIISLFVAGLVLYSFYDTADNTEIYSLSVVYDEKQIYSLKANDANNEYGLYMPFTQLAEIGSFGLAGDGDKYSLFIIGTDNRIEGTVNSSLVVINDNPVRISAPILYDSELKDYMIPIVLIENYINGIDVSYDDEKMVCAVSSSLSKANVSLKLLLPQGMANAYFPDSYKYYDVSDIPSE